MKRKVIVSMCVLVCLPIVVPSARSSPVAIDPDTGWSGYFVWTDGTGPLEGISTKPYVWGHMSDWELGNTEWSITLPAGGVMTFIKTQDPYFPPGDKWAMYVDGSLVPWTNSYTDGGGYFHGDYSDLALSAGTHLITLDVTAIVGANFPIGSGIAQFSPTAPIVPAPDAVLLGAIGVSVVGWLGRRRWLWSSFSSCREVIRHS